MVALPAVAKADADANARTDAHTDARAGADAEVDANNARLFIPLWPGPIARNALLGWRDAWAWNSGAVLVAPERLHLTLHFIGAVRRSRIAELAPALQLADGAPAFDLTIDRSAIWPHGIAVLQPSVLPPPLLDLHRSLRAVLQRLELPVEARAFRPHVTLARHANGATPPIDQPPLRWRVRGYALIESQTAPAGYRVLQRYR